MDLGGITVMETGGMKGRRRELTRPELHAVLKEAFQVPVIHSEYGMTELLSQAYSPGDALFTPAPTLRFLATELHDPFQPVPPGRTGILNAIDLANLDTCAFIATEDLGKVHADGRFEVLGRADAAELRGCNLMVE
jgi:non-ribosomal peptide synthetase component F